MNTQKKTVLLFDMDGTTYDFQTPLANIIQQTTTLPAEARNFLQDTNNRTKIALWELLSSNLEEQASYKKIIEPLYQSREFFASLRPYPGAVEIIHKLAEKHHIYFCTKPSKKNCDSEGAKREAIIRDFGADFSKSIIMAHDKTMIQGDILIDDNADIHGIYRPSRKHILVDQAHNQHSNLPRITIQDIASRVEKIEKILYPELVSIGNNNNHDDIEQLQKDFDRGAPYMKGRPTGR